MLGNENYSQNPISVKILRYPVRVEIPIDLGKNDEEIRHGILVATTAFEGLDITGYEFVCEKDGTVRLKGEGPYSKGVLLKVVKEAILKDIEFKEGKQKSLLRSSLETSSFYSRGD